MRIPFFLPDIDDEDIQSVVNVLKSGWITSGPQLLQFEEELASYTQTSKVRGLFSATAALEIALRVYGVGPGDEVITTPYTYASSANVILHVGAKPVLVDIAQDGFNIDPAKIASAITEKTKAIIPVDIAGFPCDYPQILDILNNAKKQFKACNPFQEHLGRILLLSDAAHSLGAQMSDGTSAACHADLAAFSFHAVKNLTTAEGGALTISPIWGALTEDFFTQVKLWSLHGQNKDALSKQKGNQWRYDILFPGYKCNMTDIQAALGRSQLKRYAKNLERRKELFAYFTSRLSDIPQALSPDWLTHQCRSSYHLFPLRLAGMGEQQRDDLISAMYEKGISLNVHFQPLPMLTAYKNLGYKMQDYPISYQQYAHEVSLPLYPQLTHEQVDDIVDSLKICLGG